MRSRFDRYDRLSSRATDHVYAEPFEMTPMMGGPNGRKAPDPDRQRIEGRAAFSDRPVDAPIQMGDRKSSGGNAFRAMVKTRRISISIDRRYFNDAVGDPIENNLVRQGDLIRLPSRDGLNEFNVVSAQPDGHARIVVILDGGRRAG